MQTAPTPTVGVDANLSSLPVSSRYAHFLRSAAVCLVLPSLLLPRTVAGVCTALALKKLGRTIAIGFGFTFIALQGLQYAGVVENVRC